jgi:hypothetical protein
MTTLFVAVVWWFLKTNITNIRLQSCKINCNHWVSAQHVISNSKSYFTVHLGDKSPLAYYTSGKERVLSHIASIKLFTLNFIQNNVYFILTTKLIFNLLHLITLLLTINFHSLEHEEVTKFIVLTKEVNK